MNSVPMKHKLLVLGLAAGSLITLAVGCNKQETPVPAASADAAKTTDAAAADAQNAADLRKAADAKKAAEDLKAADAQKLNDAIAQKQAEADKADQALKQAAADKLAADQTAADKQAQLTAGASKVQALIESAKTLSGQSKWADVLKVLAQLAGEKLSPAQQTAVDSLQTQAKAAVAQKATADAGSALGGLLDGKK